MDYNKISANVMVQIVKSLTEEYMLCVKHILTQASLINSSKDDNVIVNAGNILRYYEIRCNTVSEILERISNIMKEEGVPILSEDEISSIFANKTPDELKKIQGDPDLLQEFKDTIKNYLDKRNKEGKNGL